MYIYIYIEREREIERERDVYMCIYRYIGYVVVCDSMVDVRSEI